MNQEDMKKFGITQEMLNQTRRDMDRDTLYSFYQKFVELKNLVGDEFLTLNIRNPESGSIVDSHHNCYVDWDTADEGAQAIDKEIARIREEGI